jgi:hypothetical protein
VRDHRGSVFGDLHRFGFSDNKNASTERKEVWGFSDLTSRPDALFYTCFVVGCSIFGVVSDLHTPRFPLLNSLWSVVGFDLTFGQRLLQSLATPLCQWPTSHSSNSRTQSAFGACWIRSAPLSLLPPATPTGLGWVSVASLVWFRSGYSSV